MVLAAAFNWPFGAVQSRHMNHSVRIADPPMGVPRHGAAAAMPALCTDAAGVSRQASGVDGDRTPAAGSAPRDRPGPTRGEQAAPARVLVVDDHAIVREGIASVLDSDLRIEVVGEAGDGVEALELLQQLQADVVLMDVNMPRMNGIEATREIHERWPGLLTVGLSVQSDPPTADLMREAGAAGFIPKSGDSGEMIATILQVVADGGGASEG